MRQEELIAFIIERGSMTSGEVAKEFGIPVTFAHQVLRRLKDKGVLEAKGGPRRYNFQLSSQAKQMLEVLREDKKGRSWIFLMGLSIGILLGLSANEESDDEESKGDTS